MKPTILFDFGPGRIAERLPAAAVAVLHAKGLPSNKFQQDLRAYFRAKPVVEARPRQVLQLVSRYVEVQPLNLEDMRLAVGPDWLNYL